MCKICLFLLECLLQHHADFRRPLGDFGISSAGLAIHATMTSKETPDHMETSLDQIPHESSANSR
jgi:hypothetical protein